MNEIVISFVIPVYNVEKYLNECISSLLKKKTNNIELLLIDDGSTDGSGSLCDNFASNYEIVRAFHKKNGGLSDARNYGMKKAKGDYIAFLDSDDIIDADSIEYILKTIKYQHPDVIVLKHKEFSDILPSISEVDCSMVKYECGIDYLNDAFKKRFYLACVPFCVYKKELITNRLFEYGIVHEDEMWTPQVFLNANTVIKSNYCYYYYRNRPESITTKKDKTKGSRDLIYICNYLYNIFNKANHRLRKGLAKDYLCTLYLSAFVDWVDSGMKSIDLRFKRLFPLKCARSFKNIAKSFLFFVSPKIYRSLHK